MASCGAHTLEELVLAVTGWVKIVEGSVLAVLPAIDQSSQRRCFDAKNNY
jgi:hypothetical protein